ncbi:hypothetical protein Sgly_2584 [Syntrophobotulus glycolicus DSM 8271]|uniref:Uncharacterized protein n=1 Tax=Syntrophobotulus glycolicus (strain DSM 8271 / FlGlyR) TaxID=645991 RepID=F0SWM3_SYNGF|nr:hypothetical protein Sgly_2584 [Syntrophobotulus glycolicus DSM 8271]
MPGGRLFQESLPERRLIRESLIGVNPAKSTVVGISLIEAGDQMIAAGAVEGRESNQNSHGKIKKNKGIDTIGVPKANNREKQMTYRAEGDLL